MQSQCVNLLVVLGCLVSQSRFSSESKNSFVDRFCISSVLLSLVAHIQFSYAFTKTQVDSDKFPPLPLNPAFKMISVYRHIIMVIAEVPLQIGLSLLKGYLSSPQEHGYINMLSHDNYWILSAVNAILAASKVQKGVIGHTTHLPAMLLRLVDGLVTNSSGIKKSFTHILQATQGAVANGLIAFGNGLVETAKTFCRARDVSDNGNSNLTIKR